eukprot:2295719-Prymnesium_polylepis.1
MPRRLRPGLHASATPRRASAPGSSCSSRTGRKPARRSGRCDAGRRLAAGASCASASFAERFCLPSPLPPKSWSYWCTWPKTAVNSGPEIWKFIDTNRHAGRH